MKKFLMAAALAGGLALPATVTEARVPLMKGNCPGDLVVMTKVADGPVFFNDKEAMVTVFNKDYAIAKLNEISIGISLDANDALSLQYENSKTGVNILCKIEYPKTN